MKEQVPPQVSSARRIALVLKVFGGVTALVGVFGGLVVMAEPNGPLGFFVGFAALVSGAVLYGFGEALETLAAILLEVWEQGGD